MSRILPTKEGRVWLEGGVHGREWHAWPGGLWLGECMARGTRVAGGVCVPGGCAWPGGARVAGGVCVPGGCAWPGGACVAGGVCVPGGCAWWGVHGCGHVCSGANVSMGHAWKEKMATAAGSAHPTRMHSCLRNVNSGGFSRTFTCAIPPQPKWPYLNAVFLVKCGKLYKITEWCPPLFSSSWKIAVALSANCVFVQFEIRKYADNNSQFLQGCARFAEILTVFK